MVMWIVLGSLIGVVIIFLVITSTLDRKKSKKIKIEKELLSKEISHAGTTISKEVVKVIRSNAKAIKNFVPSVGKVKMSQINKTAKDSLKDIQRSKNFKLLKHNTDKFNLFSNHMMALTSQKSNNWAKRNQEDIIFFVEYKETKEEDPKKLEEKAIMESEKNNKASKKAKIKSKEKKAKINNKKGKNNESS